MKRIQLARSGYLVIAVIFYLAGILSLICPVTPLSAGHIVSGGVLVLYGGVKLMGFLSSRQYCAAFRHDLLYGLCLMALGVLILILRRGPLPCLPASLGALILVDHCLVIPVLYGGKTLTLDAWVSTLIIAVVISCFVMLQIVKLCPELLSSRLVIGLVLLSMGLKNQCVVLYTTDVIRRGS